jgi:hypothetical protein
MSNALIVAAALAQATEALPSEVRSRPTVQVDRSKSDQDRLRELEIAIAAAHARGEIDHAAATDLRLAVARTRRQMVRMGIQVGYRQRVRLRQRIDGLYARLDARRAAPGR